MATADEIRAASVAAAQTPATATTTSASTWKPADWNTLDTAGQASWLTNNQSTLDDATRKDIVLNSSPELYSALKSQSATATTTPTTTPTTTTGETNTTDTTTQDVDYAAQMKAALDAQLAQTTDSYNAERAKIPGQVTTQNNTASATGVVNASHIRNALSQMGLLQSGESATQQLNNDISVASNINANTLAGQELDASYADKIAAAQAQAAVDYNNLAYQYYRDDVSDSQWQTGSDQTQQQIDNQATQFASTLEQNASQFESTFGLSQQQFAEEVKQNGLDNVYRDEALDQAADQFAEQMDLSRDEFDAQVEQWAEEFEYQQEQDEIDNEIDVGTLTGYYNGKYYKDGKETSDSSSSSSSGSSSGSSGSSGTVSDNGTVTKSSTTTWTDSSTGSTYTKDNKTGVITNVN